MCIYTGLKVLNPSSGKLSRKDILSSDSLINDQILIKLGMWTPLTLRSVLKAFKVWSGFVYENSHFSPVEGIQNILAQNEYGMSNSFRNQIKRTEVPLAMCSETET